MNNFTKEELELLKNYIYRNYKELPEKYWPKEDYDLFIKLQTMIDNYCEHESDGYAYYKSGVKCSDFLLYASSESACMLKCKKCLELFDDGRP